MKTALTLAALLMLSGCGQIANNAATAMRGYVMECIDGTQYVFISTDRGVAITPHVGTDGKPKGCTK